MNRIIAFLCVFMYFASPYRLFGHAMPEILGLIAILLQLTQSRKIGFIRGYGDFMIYMLFIPPVVSFLTGLPGNYFVSFLPISLLFYSITFCVLLPNLDMNYVLRYYKLLVYISVGFFFCQEVGFYLLGIRPTLYLPLEMYYEDSTLGEFEELRANTDRSASFFLEPAHFAQYILPYYCIISYNVLKNRKHVIEFFVFTAALLSLKSGCGFIGMLAIFISVLFIKGLVPSKVKIAVIVSFGIGVLMIIHFFIKNQFVVELLSRFDEISSLEVTVSGSQSGFLRIWRGYFIYDVLAPVYKFFGVGVGSIEYVSSLIYIQGSRYEGSYLNGIQTLLVTGGIVGTILFARFVHIFYRRISYEGRLILVCMMSIFFIEHMLFTPKMFLFVLIAMAVNNNQKRIFGHTLNTK